MPKIARIIFLSSTPPTRISSGYHTLKAGKSPIMDKLSETYDLQTFCWVKRREQSITLKRVYLIDGVPIFASLLCCLLKGRFNAVITSGIPVLESIPTFIIAKFLRIPIIIKETHWYWPNTLSSKFAWPINKLMVSHSDLVICPGKKAYQYWLSIGIPQQKIMIVPFYTSVLHADENNKKLANELDVKYRNKLVVLYLGRLIKKKGVDYLIRAFQQLQQEFSDTVLVITGEGPEKTHLEELCTELGLSNVEFVDAPDETSKPAWFLFSDVYVYPSVTLDLPEEWSLAVMEAMSVGKPVIVTDAVGSAPDLVRAGVNGYVVIEKDSKALYTALKQVIGNEKLRKQMSVMSKKIIDDSFTYEHAVSAFDEAIKSVLCK